MAYYAGKTGVNREGVWVHQVKDVKDTAFCLLLWAVHFLRGYPSGEYIENGYPQILSYNCSHFKNNGNIILESLEELHLEGVGKNCGNTSKQRGDRCCSCPL